ncbi:MAG: SpoIIIAH-like family protein [Bacteroides sp.]|nr:SpoIIIAH-like family protein [Eubacterium sp.]MCM1418831.1 SpoIIIAH-like family protein [Roseburia sp.]MCM1462105.1 SpoIIIAH-like family protein [Bacteroides sp.]
MKRINLIIGKKQLILAGLTVLLGAAVYVNYLYSSPTPETGESERETANYGDVRFVSSELGDDPAISVSSTDSDAYFAQARLDKQQSRDETVEMLRSFYFGGDSTGDELAVIAQNVAEVGNYMETETKVENLLKAQGFSEALCYLSDTSANVIVKTQGLDTAQAAQIKSTLLGEIAVPVENITIVEIK